MRHLGILATTPEGASLCFRAFCQEGFSDLGPHDHPEVTLDCIALARTLPYWAKGDYAAVRATLAVSVRRLAAAGADFFACPDNTAHLALEQPGPNPGGARSAHSRGRRHAGIPRPPHAGRGARTCHTMRGPVYPRALAARGIAAEIPDEHDREALDDLIVGELVRGVLPDAPGRTASALSSAWRPGAATRSPSSAPSSRSRLRRPTRRCPCWTRPDC